MVAGISGRPGSVFARFSRSPLFILHWNGLPHRSPEPVPSAGGHYLRRRSSALGVRARAAWFSSPLHNLPDSDTGRLRSPCHSEAVTMDMTRMTGTVRRPSVFHGEDSLGRPRSLGDMDGTPRRVRRKEDDDFGCSTLAMRRRTDALTRRHRGHARACADSRGRRVDGHAAAGRRADGRSAPRRARGSSKIRG